MATRSRIEWTNTTWNVITGCTKVSPGCKNCYAETIANRFWGERKFTDIQLHYDRLQQPLHWKKPRMIFVNSMSDLFHEDIPFTFIDNVFEVMGYSTQHTFQILTKRPERALEYYKWTKIFDAWDKWNHIWLGTSVENQEQADKRIPILLQIPTVKVRWISAEPVLGEIDLEKFISPKVYGHIVVTEKQMKQIEKDFVKVFNINWVVCSGESGRNKRPFDLQWARILKNQCKAAKVPFFMKQVDKIQQIPEDLMIREYPKKETLFL